MKMVLKNKLLAKLPKKYHDRVRAFEKDDDLIDDCRYMLYWTDKYTDGECYGSSYPVRTIQEAVEFVKNSLYE